MSQASDLEPDVRLSLLEYAGVVAGRLRTVVATVAVVVAVAVGATALITPQYLGRSTVVLSVAVDPGARFLNRAPDYNDELVRSCVALATRPVVLGPALAGVGAALDVEQLAAATRVRAVRESVIIEIRVGDPDPRRAAALADAVAARTAIVCNEMGPAVAGASLFSFSPAVQSSVPQQPSSPRWRLNLVLAAVLGLLAGIALAIAQDATRPFLGRNTRPSLSTSRTLLGRVPRGGGRRARLERDRLVARLLGLCDENMLRSVLVVSSGRREATSDAVRELVQGLAETGRRVLLVDEPVPVSASGAGESGPVPNIASLLSDLPVEHDLVLVVVPSVVEQADGLALATAADAVVVVGGARTPVGDVEEEAAAVRRVGGRVLGLVVTG